MGREVPLPDQGRPGREHPVQQLSVAIVKLLSENTPDFGTDEKRCFPKETSSEHAVW